MTFHESHVPAEPRDIGLGTGLVYCKACGALLYSDRGPGVGRRVAAPCEPNRVALR